MRKINNQEKRILFHQKLSNGLDEDSASYEIERDNCLIENINYDFKKLHLENIKLKKENERLKELHNNNLVPKEREPSLNKTIGITKECSFLVRVMNYFSDGKKANKELIKQELSINSQELNFCLDFLVKYKFLNKVKEKNMEIYSWKK